MKPEIVAGRIPVLECLRAGRRGAHKLHALQGGEGLGDIIAAAGAKTVPVARCGRKELDALSDGVVHQGVVLEADPLPVLSADGWIDRDRSPDAIVIILDGVQDPQNFGSIVRSAAACGASAVMFAKDRAAPVSTAAVKAAAGAMEYVDLVQAVNLVRAIDALKDGGFWVTGLDAAAPKLLWETDMKGKTALVIGSEGKGIRRLVSEHCDLHVRIPLKGPISSLNAGVSAAIALAECLRQRA